jgi:hypothetical protein
MSSKDRSHILQQEKTYKGPLLAKEVVVTTDPNNFKPVIANPLKGISSNWLRLDDPLLRKSYEIRKSFIKDDNICLKLVLDLDETLVSFCDQQEANVAVKSNKKLCQKKVETYGQTNYVIYPIYLEKWIQAVAKYYSIIVYSRGSDEYVKEVVKILDNTGILIPQRNVFCRDSDNSLKDFQRVKFLKATDRNGIILDDSISAWTSYKSVYQNFLFSKIFLFNQNSFNKQKSTEYYFKKDNHSYKLGPESNEIFLTSFEDHEERLLSIESFLVRLANQYYDTVLRYPNYVFMSDIKTILRDFRADIFRDKEFFIVTENPLVRNCTEFVLENMGARISPVYSKEITVLIESKSLGLAKSQASSSAKLVNIKYAFDSFFYGKAVDIKRYELNN